MPRTLADLLCPAGPRPLRHARWQPFRGPRGGQGWQDGATGRVVYGDRPGDGPGAENPVPPPAAAGGATPLSPPSAERLLGAAADAAAAGWAWARQAGHTAEAVERVAADFVAHGVDERIGRLPPALRGAVSAVWKLTKLGTAAAFSTYLWGQHAAAEAAAAAGCTPEQAARVRGICTALDLAGAKAVPLGLAVLGLGPVGAAGGSALPIGSLTYLAYATARHPVATLRAATRAVALAARAVAHAGQSAAPVRHAREGERGTLPGAIRQAAVLARRVRQHEGDGGWYEALLYAALDRADSLDAAVAVADRAAADHPAHEVIRHLRRRAPLRYAWEKANGGQEVGRSARGLPLFKWVDTDRRQRPRVQSVMPGSGRAPAAGEAPTRPLPATATPPAAVGEVLAGLNRGDVTDEHVAGVTRALLALPRAQMHALRVQLGLPEKGLKGATRDRLAARLIAHARGEPAGGGAVEDVVRQVEAARRGEDVDGGGLARRLESLTLADLRAIRAKVGGAADRTGLSTRLLAALHRRAAPAPVEDRPATVAEGRPDAAGQRAFDWDAVAAGKRGARKGTVVRPTQPAEPPPEPPPPPEEPEDPAAVRKRERERWTGQLDRIGVGDSGYVGGVFVRRTGPSVWRTETERGFVQGDAERMLQHVASVRQDVGLYGRQLKEALARFKNAPRNAAPGGGSLFGGDDLQAQRGFARLPQGAAVAITEGGYKGRVGRIVREEVAPGRYRVLVRPEGSSEAIPIHHGSVEPLDPKLSWRVDRSDQPPPTRQSKLFRRGDSLPYLRQARRALAAGDRAGARVYLRRAIRYGARRAPKGGVTIAGTFYPGGRFIPGEVLAGATAAERATLQAPRRDAPGQGDLFGGDAAPPAPKPARKRPAAPKKPADAGDLFDRPRPPAPPPPPAEAPYTGPPPPTPGFTGTDTLGRAWQDGRLTGAPAADAVPAAPPEPLAARGLSWKELIGCDLMDPATLKEFIRHTRISTGSLPEPGILLNEPRPGFLGRMFGAAGSKLPEYVSKGWLEIDPDGDYRLTVAGAVAFKFGVLATTEMGPQDVCLPPLTSRAAANRWLGVLALAPELAPIVGRLTGLPGDTPLRMAAAAHAVVARHNNRADPVRRRVRQDREVIAVVDRLAAQEPLGHFLVAATEAVEKYADAVNAYVRGGYRGAPPTPPPPVHQRIEAHDERQRNATRATLQAVAALVPEAERMPLRCEVTDPQLGEMPRAMTEWIVKHLAPAVGRPSHGRPLPTVQVSIDPKDPYRAACVGTDKIFLSTVCTARDVPYTIAHELGHALENNDPEIHAACQSFLADRIGDEREQPLAQLFPTAGYGPAEYGRKDQFDRALSLNAAYYTGKTYSDGSTEVFSIGLEYLLRDPGTFCRKDPEYAALVIGVLTGRIRKKPEAPHAAPAPR